MHLSRGEVQNHGRQVAANTITMNNFMIFYFLILLDPYFDVNTNNLIDSANAHCRIKSNIFK